MIDLAGLESLFEQRVQQTSQKPSHSVIKKLGIEATYKGRQGNCIFSAKTSTVFKIRICLDSSLSVPAESTIFGIKHRRINQTHP